MDALTPPATVRPVPPADSPARAGRDALVIAAGYLTGFAYPLVSLPVLARTLGVHGLGTLLLLLAVLQIAVHVSDFGFGIAALRRTALVRDRDGLSRVLAETTAAKVLVWAACAVPLLGVCALVGSFRAHLGLLTIGLLLVLGGALFPGWLLQGIRRPGVFALAMGLSRVVALGGLLLTVRGPDGLLAALVWQLAPPVLAAVAVWCWLLVTGRVTAMPRPGAGAVRAALRDAAPVFVAQASVVVISSSGSLALGATAGTAQVAYLGAAERFANAVRGVMRGVSDAMLPRLTGDPSRTLERTVVLGVVGAHVLAAVVLLVGAGTIVPWYLGEAMTPATPVVRLVALAVVLYGVTSVGALRANAAHRYRRVARVTAIGAGVHLLLVVPAAATAGANGVLAVVILAEATVASLYLIAARRDRGAAR